MITNNTPASAVTNSNTKQQTFFDSHSTSNTSSTFNVDTAPFYLHAYNLASGDSITVQTVDGSGSGNLFAPFAPLSAPIVLTNATPQCRIDWPGRYRLIFSGTSVTAITVVGNEANFSEDSIYQYGGGGGGGGGFSLVTNNTTTIDLAFAGTTAGGTLTANANVAALPQVGNGAWPDTLVSASQLGRICYVTFGGVGDTANFGYQAGNWPLGLGPGTTDYGETCIGFNAGRGAHGQYKTCIGSNAGNTQYLSGILSSRITAVGAFSLDLATPGPDTEGFVAIGYRAGEVTAFDKGVIIGNTAGGHTSANDMVAIGDSAGSSVIGDNNISIGNSSLNSSTANNCTSIGHFALQTRVGNRCVAVGYAAGQLTSSSDGDDCIFIGMNAGRGDSHNNIIVIASGPTDINCTADNQILLGTASHTELRTAGSIISGGSISASDTRLKQNIKPITGALDKINSLAPITYEWDEDALLAAKLPYRECDLRKSMGGFAAQDLKKVFPEAITLIDGADGEKYMFVHYDRLVGHMVGALQELSSRVSALEASKAG